MASATIPPFVGILGLSLLPNEPHYKWTKWGLYFMTVPFVLALFLVWTLIPSNVAGRTKKTIISSGTFLGYCVDVYTKHNLPLTVASSLPHPSSAMAPPPGMHCPTCNNFLIPRLTKGGLAPNTYLAQTTLRPRLVRRDADSIGNKLRNAGRKDERGLFRASGYIGRLYEENVTLEDRNVCFGLEFMLIIAWQYYYIWQNKRRDAAAAASGVSAEEQEAIGREMGELNVTDLKNPHFR
ncbi:hypothetical protein C8R44DRAFT_878066 [Mycena epipterygia]|nr:hypothetical protein C8R44DRAFT_878066 [Mycena epipterygia]